MTLDEKSLARLRDVHPDLRKVIERAALTAPPFRVIEGRRTLERQKYLVAKGASKTLKSRHLTGHAVDIAPLVNGQVSWDWTHYHPLAKLIKQAAKELNIPIEWGGDWTSFKDGPHWQLPRARYPDA
jgi:peptidoglycan L-alanyl-D-glutamate endopeptidase CwlK